MLERVINKDKIVDHLFWITFLLFTNPGGILSALGEDSSDGGVNVTDLLMIVLLGCYVVLLLKSNKIDDHSFHRALKYIVIFLAYYLIVFGFFVPLLKDNSSYNAITAFIKMRHGVINVILLLIVYEFFFEKLQDLLQIFCVHVHYRYAYVFDYNSCRHRTITDKNYGSILR